MAERIVSGAVRADGQVLEGQGFHVSRKTAGSYLILFQPPLSAIENGMAQLIDTRHAGLLKAAVSSVDGLHAAITVTDAANAMRDCAFSFVFTGQNHEDRMSLPRVHPLDPTGVIADPAIGSPAPPVVSLRRSHETAQAPDSGEDLSPLAQLKRLKETMQQVLRPLQRENRMLKSRLEITARQTNGGRRIVPAADAFPQIEAGPLLTLLLRQHRFQSVLDLGQPDLQRLALLAADGRQVTGVVTSAVASLPTPNVTLRQHAPVDPETPFDCVIAIDLLQRQVDPQAFLRRAHGMLAEGGVLALSVPAMRYPLVTGDLSIWSGGLLLYHLVLSGFDCRNVKMLTQGEQIFLVLVKTSIEPAPLGVPLPLPETMRVHLPHGLEFVETPDGGLAFDGDLPAIGWTI
ncbi:methyltransferase domain-containing protein [Rhizobium sp. FY34]|uniref:class I SAM-dependent methyltransferase n=1 Tax=Rhizobium sp. FY34 TaxID=2562309 RepID=UPI0010C04484|nr:methyltransferase domain-containing protein [Rhizobium sp. FY34]